MNKEHTPNQQTKRVKLAAVGALEGALIGTSVFPLGIPIGAAIGAITAYAAEPIATIAAEYIHVVGWLGQMDPTYPHTEFHPYPSNEPMPELPPEPELMAG